MSIFSPVERQGEITACSDWSIWAGKTLSALYIAYGMTGDWEKIALIDTEHERARFYANREDLGTGCFLYAPMAPPYGPEKYKSMVEEGANAVGSDGVVIVDSLSHAWNNEGGVFRIKDRIASQAGKTSYTAWGEAGRYQNSLINTILSVPCHTIVTMRSKMEYALVENDKGKSVPKKEWGLAPVQREDTEYEFDIVLDIDRNHVATTSKDTTFLDTFADVITPKLGEDLRIWLSEGKEPEKCDICGCLIKPTSTKSVVEIVEGTMKSMGKKACAKCCLEWVKETGARTPENEEAQKHE